MPVSTQKPNLLCVSLKKYGMYFSFYPQNDHAERVRAKIILPHVFLAFEYYELTFTEHAKCQAL